MRVLHLASGDLWGGAEAMVLDLALAQQRLGHEVVAVLFNDGLLAERLRGCGIPVSVFPESQISAFGLLQRLRRLCRELRPDVLHSHRMKETIIGATAARMSGVPICVRTVHGNNEHALAWSDLRKALARLAERLASATLVSATVAVSIELGERLRNRLLARHVFVIENGVDLERIQLQAATPTGMGPRQIGSYRVGVVGRLVPVKRVDLFMDACDALARHSGRSVEAIIVGDGPLRSELEVRSATLKNVRYMFTGFVDRPAAWIRDLDLLAITSDHEGLPMCLLEALALDVPVVARAVGGIPAVLNDCTRGCLVTSDSAESFAAAMLATLDTHSTTAAAPAQDRFPAALTIRTTAQRYCDLYSRLAKTGPTTATSDAA